MTDFCALINRGKNKQTDNCLVMKCCNIRDFKSDVWALHYKAKGRGFESLFCHWNFHWHNSSGRTMDGVDSASNRNEYQEYFLGVDAAVL